MRGVITALVSFLLLIGGGAHAFALPTESAGPGPDTQIVRSMRLRGTPRRVFQLLGQRYGVRILVDDKLRGRPLRLSLTQADFETALRVASKATGAFWLWQPDGSVLVLEDSKENHEFFDPQVMRVFDLPGHTAEELTEILRLLRELIDLRHIAQDIRSNTLTIRDTPRRLAAAASLIEQLTAEREQVVVDVLVLEVDSDKARSLGILPPDLAVLVHIGAGILPTDNALEFLRVLRELVDQGVLPRVLLSDRFDLTQGVGFVGLGKGRTQFLANLPGANFSFSDILLTTRSLRRVTLRATSGEEATFFAGERFPVTFTTFSSSFIPQIIQDLIDQGQFIPPVPAVRYEDLGIKLTVRPQVQGAREVSLKITLETTQLVGDSLNAIPILASRKVEQQARLQAGESLLLAGLRNRELVPIRTGLPVLSSLPLLGRLFSRTETRVRETEFLVLVTPRIVRQVPRKLRSQRALYLGTEKEFSPLGSRPRISQPRAPDRRRPGQPRQPTPPPPTPPGRNPQPPRPQQQP